MPLWSLLGWLLAWEALVRLAHIPHYTLPAPSLVLQTLFAHFGSLAASWWFTLKITLGALSLAVMGGVLIAAVFTLSARLEAVVLPLAVVLQVTPIVAIAPLMLIYIDSTTAALLLCAWIVAFFPILANTAAALAAAAQRTAVLCGGAEGVGRSEPDRRRHRGDGRWRGGARNGSGLAHPGGELSHRNAKNVRSAAAAGAHRADHPCGVQSTFPSLAGALARQRAGASTVAVWYVRPLSQGPRHPVRS
jgi:hypothetical protein